MTKIYYSKEPIKIGKCLNDEPLNPIKPKRKHFKNPFINTYYIDRIVDNFFKEQMKDAMRNQIERFGFTLHDVHLHFANGVDGHTMELADEAYNELISDAEKAVQACEGNIPKMLANIMKVHNK